MTWAGCRRARHSRQGHLAGHASYAPACARPCSCAECQGKSRKRAVSEWLTEDGEEDVDEEVSTAAALEEDT